MKLRNRNIVYVTLLLVFQVNAYAQTKFKKTINWSKSTDNTEKTISSHTFVEAHINSEEGIPSFSDQIKVDGFGEANFRVIDFKAEETNIDLKTNISTSPEISSFVMQERNKYAAVYSFTPFIRNRSTGKIDRITEIQLEYQWTPKPTPAYRGGPIFKTTSLLRDGNIYKIAVTESGVYKITHADLEKWEVDPASIDPRKIQLLGNPDGMNPESNSADQHDDLLENAIFIQGESDGSFDSDDFIVFYGHGPHSWNSEGYTHNIYDDNNYYFLKVGNENGLRVQSRPSLSGAEFTDNFDTYKRYEKDAFNLLSDFASTQGSGKLWFSEKYSSNAEQDFSSVFSDANLDLEHPVNFEIQFAGRYQNSSSAILKVEGRQNIISFNSVSVSNIESRYADLEKKVFTHTLTTTNPSITLSYPQAANGASGWLDYIHMDYRAKLRYSGQPVSFRRFDSADKAEYGYSFESSQSGVEIWDITKPDAILKQEYDNNAFTYNTGGVNEFVIFEMNAAHKSATFVEKVNNQNLHGLTRADALIIYHPEFQDAAEKLAMHRADHSDLNVIAVPVHQVYNEFSSGRVDVPGIRNFARMIYERDPSFKFLTLFGDGSFDYKHVGSSYGDENLMPVYETNESMSPIRAFPTDDFYALLSPQEGANLRGGLDIAVGRIPVTTSAQANAVVDKIINYDQNEDTYADWRLRIGFASDDEDNNVHVRDADGIAESARLKYSKFNVEKMYFDAYPQVSTPGGERYPLASSAINNNIFKGMLSLCYLGHGGPTGWAQERVLKEDDFDNWDNENRLPLLVTATCSFTGYDSPKFTSAGEQVFLKEKTGAIALMSTVRAVYVNQNKRLTSAVFDTIFTKPDGEFMGLGEVLRRAKNTNAADTLDVNARKFQLIGDPSQKLAIPELQIVTSSINGVPVDEDYAADTIKALQKMTFEGYVADDDGNILDDFNGKVFASVFDKLVQSKTLANNTSSREQVFNIQKTILFKGQSAVENGKFTFEFYLPSEINFTYGNGKISLYAKSGARDAAGNFSDFIIGGSDDGNPDDTPPIVDVYMNTEDFAFGGLSTSDPVLLVKLQDDFGINVAGVSVGHDLVAELDNNPKERYILNDFYESELNNFRRGTVRFPLKGIAPGKHSIKIKAYDLSNNLGEGYTEFIVSDDIGESLNHVFNYPNPFSTQTTFMFEHNLPGAELEILINIYNMSGQIVKTIEHMVLDDGFRVDDITWNGRDDYDQKIANGVYLYKIKVHANQLGIKKESNFQKLVILR